MKLTKEERKIKKDLEMGKYVRVPNMKQEILRFQKVAKGQAKRKLTNKL